jgi:indolepyruvate ferredoxin oxidoreductase beta subunit
VLAPDEVEANRYQLRPGGALIEPRAVAESKLANKRSLNVAMLGVLSRGLTIPESAWMEAIRANLAPKLHEANLEAFRKGRGR